ncbi:uncharacterized protein LOC131540807 [Onychostoma macrolepis]|uniref:uncharacterized protein LOC131540807 n=1 Tax=Onychostoma macrolepis TaxID=369639 RepID=UPI00272B0896|nr:uncharacterized protein LOC131540807 [Onychostoma macrolepis]
MIGKSVCTSCQKQLERLEYICTSEIYRGITLLSASTVDSIYNGFYIVVCCHAARRATRLRGRHGSSGAARWVFPGDEPARVEELRRTSTLCGCTLRENKQGNCNEASRKTGRPATLRLIIHEKTFLSKWMVSKDGGHVLEQHLGFADGYVFFGCLSFSPLCFCCSQVSTISESFFQQHLGGDDEDMLSTAGWLKITAANGLDIPYLGYLELEIETMG